jgi:hypothetical protein
MNSNTADALGLSRAILCNGNTISLFSNGLIRDKNHYMYIKVERFRLIPLFACILAVFDSSQLM